MYGDRRVIRRYQKHQTGHRSSCSNCQLDVKTLRGAVVTGLINKYRNDNFHD